MSLYWPDKKVALVIVDEASEAHTTTDDDGWTVFRVTSHELDDYDTLQGVMSTVAQLVEGGEGEQADAGKSRGRVA